MVRRKKTREELFFRDEYTPAQVLWMSFADDFRWAYNDVLVALAEEYKLAYPDLWEALQNRWERERKHAENG